MGIGTAAYKQVFFSSHTLRRLLVQGVISGYQSSDRSLFVLRVADHLNGISIKKFVVEQKNIYLHKYLQLSFLVIVRQKASRYPGFAGYNVISFFGKT